MNNTVIIPRNLYDHTITWSAEMLALAQQAKRKNSLGVFYYTFEHKADAIRLYALLTISVEYDDSIVMGNIIHPYKATKIREAQSLSREYDNTLVIDDEVTGFVLDDLNFEALLSWSGK